MGAAVPRPSLEALRAAVREQPRVPMHRDGYRRAAVLIPLIPTDGDWDLLLTRRNSDLPHHRGQIAFPGGSVDEGEDCQMAALREAEEEIGLIPSRVEVLGCQDDIWTPSGFIISPVHGVVPANEDLHANPAEVARIFRVPLSYFADDRNVDIQRIEFEGKEREVYFYRYDGETIWGATALIIRNFLRIIGLLEQEKPPIQRQA